MKELFLDFREKGEEKHYKDGYIKQLLCTYTEGLKKILNRAITH